MNPIRTFAAVATLWFVGSAPVLAQGTTFTNGTFATGLTGWQSFGDVVVAGPRKVVALTTASVDYQDDLPNPPGFNNRSGTAAVDFFLASDLAGVPFSSLDIGGFSYEGSAIRQDFVATAGNILTITFDWAFLTTEPNGPARNPDFGFLAINDTVVDFVNTNSINLTGTFLGTFDDGSQTWSWYQSHYTYTAASNGVVSMVIGVVDINDTLFTSELRVDNIAVSAVPEPETYALMLAGLGVVGGWLRRRQRTVPV